MISNETGNSLQSLIDLLHEGATSIISGLVDENTPEEAKATPKEYSPYEDQRTSTPVDPIVNNNSLIAEAINEGKTITFTYGTIWNQERRTISPTRIDIVKDLVTGTDHDRSGDYRSFHLSEIIGNVEFAD